VTSLHLDLLAMFLGLIDTPFSMMEFSRLLIRYCVCLTYLALGVDVRIESSAATVGRDGADTGRCHRIFYETVRVFFFCSCYSTAHTTHLVQT